MINNFICVICGRYKSVGSPRKDGRYICADCKRMMEMRFDDEVKGK